MMMNPDGNLEDMLSATNFIQTNGGQVLQAWQNAVVIGEAGSQTQDVLRNFPGVTVITDGVFPDGNVFFNDPAIADFITVWNFGQTEPFHSALNNFLNGAGPAMNAFTPSGCSGGVDLEANIFFPPVNVGGRLGISGNNLVTASVLHRHRRALVGTIGVCVLQVDGPVGSTAEFQTDESTIALLGLFQGLQILQHLAPTQANLVFDVDIRRTRVEVDSASIPAPVNRDREEFIKNEQRWLYPALSNMGVTPDRSGLRELVSNSRLLFNNDWGFVFVLTKYNMADIAYSPDFQHVLVSFSMIRDLRNLIELPAIAAHEIGHTVGARDEYGQSNCHATDLCGFTNTPNLNCELENPFTVDCLMKNGKPVVCPFTRGHFGWGDHDLDSVLDPFDPEFPAI